MNDQHKKMDDIYERIESENEPLRKQIRDMDKKLEQLRRDEKVYEDQVTLEGRPESSNDSDDDAQETETGKKLHEVVTEIHELESKIDDLQSGIVDPDYDSDVDMR